MPRDALTGLVGSETVRARLSEWQAAEGAKGVAPVHAMLVGLGRFDTVNLAYGEAAGDSALIEVAARLNRLAAGGIARRLDIVANGRRQLPARGQ